LALPAVETVGYLGKDVSFLCGHFMNGLPICPRLKSWARENHVADSCLFK
jgi:hypothetical protein